MNFSRPRFAFVSLMLAVAGCSSDKTEPTPTPEVEAGMGGSTGTGGGASGGKAGGTGGVQATGGAPGTGGKKATDGGRASDSGTEARDGSTPDSGSAPDSGRSFDGSCATLPGKVVYIESGDTQENLLKNIGRHLRDHGDVTLAFNLTGSCTLTNDIYTSAKVVKNGTLKYIPSTAEDGAWTASSPEPTCTTGAAGVSIDLAISALFVDSCGLGPTPAGLSLTQGPIQAYTFITPSSVTDQTAIWAEEAYYAFGFGNSNPLALTYNPWNNESFLFIRPTTKSTLVATAKNIDVPPAKWKGVPEAASTDVVNAVTNSANAEATLGILGAEVYDADRNKGIKTLAFQAFNQKAAYFPDSTASAFDKQNVRDGHYTLWSPTVYITSVSGANVPTNPAVSTIMDAVLKGGNGFDGLADVVKVGLIPDCAMNVTRTTDGGDLSPAPGGATCTCYYLSKIPGATGTPAGCTACTDNAGCGGAACSHGFCEPDAISTTGTASASCFSGTPATNAELINACTTATGIVKNVVLPNGGTLEPLP